MTSPLSRRALLVAGLAAGPLAAAAQVQLPSPTTDLKPPYPVVGSIEKLDPALDALIDSDARVEKVFDGYLWCEGPTWIGGADGYLLTSDVRVNRIMKWSSRAGGSVWLANAGYDAPPYWHPTRDEPGPNGMALARGGLVICDQGNRQIARIDLRTKKKTTLATHFDGRRFNSPNDLVLHPNGMIFFTDPPNGLVGRATSPLRELDFTGVFSLAPNGAVSLVDRSGAPNGIGISPDGRRLYLTGGGGWQMMDIDPATGQAANKRWFADPKVTGVSGGDGLRLDSEGNMWATGGGGVQIFSPAGKRLGQIKLDDRTANVEFGADGYLYIASFRRLARVKCKAKKLIRTNV